MLLTSIATNALTDHRAGQEPRRLTSMNTFQIQAKYAVDQVTDDVTERMQQQHLDEFLDVHTSRRPQG